jgi:hypothetical protein
VGTINSVVTGTTPQGKYLRGAGPKSPINIRNIKTYTGSIGPLSGVMPIGNYRQTYEIFQSNDRSLTNIDFIFNNSNYYTGSIPTAFLTTPARRALDRTGSVDYLSPRQTGSVRTNQAIIVQRFSAPGSKQDSKQQFRDIPSDQVSPNNALPFRNQQIRRFGTQGFTGGGGFNSFLSTVSNWGGFVRDIRGTAFLGTYGPNSLQSIFNTGITPATYAPTVNYAEGPVIIAGPPQAGMASPFHKTQRNTTERIERVYVTPGGNTLMTASIRDNAYVTRPIPQADRSQWFLALSGANEIGRENYNYYLLSGSRYPVSVTAITSSLSGTLKENDTIPASTAMGQLIVSSFNDTDWNLKEFKITTTSGATYTFTANASNALNSYTRNSAQDYTYGVASATSIADIIGTIINAMNSATQPPPPLGVGDSMPLNFSEVSPAIMMQQTVAGTAGNTEILGDWDTGTAVGSYVDFTGGAAAKAAPTQRNFVGSVVTGSGNNITYLWDSEGWFPATQLQAGNYWQAKYYRKNNRFQLLPGVFNLDRDTKKFQAGTLSSVLYDRAGNAITSSFLEQVVEPPITSRYKPLVHTIKTYRGTPAETEYNQKMTVGMEYSYGNDLQAFANRSLTYQLGNPTSYSEGKIKRPYEVLRQQYLSNVSRGVTGVDKIEGMAYSETIYPKEIYTYLSGTRARLAFSNDSFWKPNHPTNINASDGFAKVSSLYEEALVERNVFTLNRLKSPFTSSQGYVLRNVEQWPWFRDSDILPLSAINFPGTGSIWPMDSFMYSELASRFPTSVAFSGSGAGEGTSIDLFAAGGSAMACGELMTTKYGHIVDERGLNAWAATPTGTVFWGTSSIVAAQYVYSVPTMLRLADTDGTPEVDPFRVGGLPTRPTWDAGRRRKNIEAAENDPIFIDTRYPFYDSYEKFAEDIRTTSKDSTIVPEFRISEHMQAYKDQNDVMLAFSGTLSLTGASHGLTSSAQPEFFNRYTTTDFHEYLQSFMGYRTKDLQFNKQPRQFDMTSQATMKLLPYEGFYPQTRTLEIATLFSQSYSSHVSYSGPDGQGETGHANRPERFRPILDPFFSPGILYNSIKSGIAVDYPIRRAGKTMAWNTTGSNFNPLQGPLTASWTVMASGYPGINYGEIPGGRRRREVNGSTDFDFSAEAVAGFFWSDRVSFESLLKPMEEISDVKAPLMSNDFNETMMIHLSASVSTTGSISDTLYRSAISNFLAATPEFFLSEKTDGGYMTKFVAKIPQKNSTTDPLGVSAAPQTEPRTVNVSANTAYIMEIGLKKTENFNMYSNPYAFGPPTSTGSVDWDLTSVATTASRGNYPEGRPWPLHRAEFAPFTPPYYYGDSMARITYMPRKNKDVTLTEILNSDEIFVEFVNSSGRYFDFASGSFMSLSSSIVARGEGTPNYLWNRAWQNRMDLDASVVIDNMFPTEMGGKVKPFDSNKWVVMPKWECPVLDFPRDGTQLEARYSPNGTIYTPSDLSGAILKLELSDKTYEAIIDDSTTIASSSMNVIGLQDASDSTEDFARAVAISLNDARLNAEFPILEVDTFLNPLTIVPTVKQPLQFTGSAFHWPVPGSLSVTNIYAAFSTPYNFSSSLSSSFVNNAGQPNWTQGMWHQYGTMPSEGEGIQLYIADVNAKSSEFRLCGAGFTGGAIVQSVRKAPLYVIESSRSIGSLANLVGFKKEEIMPANQWIPERAKPIGQLAPDGEKTISEALVAMPYYLDPKTGDIRSMTLRASSVALGPKIKEFRRAFTKYSLPPALRNELTALLPPDYPAVPDFINPFGGDDYDEILSPADILTVPVVYLMEHTVKLSRQDLADIWQGIMPEVSKTMQVGVKSIDHYMPGMASENSTAIFPEILEKQLDLGLPQTGVPRVDLLDTTVIQDWNGFVPEIKWMVFRVKQRGPTNYTSMMLQEINDGKSTENFNSIFGYLAEDLPPGARKALEKNKNQYTKNLYTSNKLGAGRNTYNWPYDYCSLIELSKISTKTTFRPDLDLGEPQEPLKGPPPFEGPLLGGSNNISNLMALSGRLGGGNQFGGQPQFLGQINQPQLLPSNLRQPILPQNIMQPVLNTPMLSPTPMSFPSQPLKPSVKPSPVKPLVTSKNKPVFEPVQVKNFNYTLKPQASPNNNRKQTFQLKKNIAQQKIRMSSPMSRRKNNFKGISNAFRFSRKKY